MKSNCADKLKPRASGQQGAHLHKGDLKMKKVTISALMVLAGVLSATSALAEGDQVRANVPFAFAVDGKVLPAGHYEIQQISDQQIPGALLVRNIDQPRYSVTVVATQAWAALPNYRPANATLVFNDYGDQHFLRTVHGSIAGLNLELPGSKAEDSAKRNQMASNATQTVLAGQ
jgi:hypothetical protein